MGNIMSDAHDGVLLVVGDKNNGSKKKDFELAHNESDDDFLLANKNLEGSTDLEFEAKDRGSRAFLEASQELDQLFDRGFFKSRNTNPSPKFEDEREKSANNQVKESPRTDKIELTSEEGDEILTSNQFQPRFGRRQMELRAENPTALAFLEADQVFDEIFERAIGRKIGPIYATRSDPKPKEPSALIPDDSERIQNQKVEHSIDAIDFETELERYLTSIDRTFRRIFGDEDK